MSGSQRDENIRDELNTLTEVSKTLITHADLPELLDAVMERIINNFPPAEFGVVFIWYPQENVFRPHGICGSVIQNPQILKEMSLHAGEAITGNIRDILIPQAIADLNTGILLHQAIFHIIPGTAPIRPFCHSSIA